MTLPKRGCYIPMGSRMDALRLKACGSKRAFATRRHAQECQPRQRAYQCEYCGNWHLTSKEKLKARRQQS